MRLIIGYLLIILTFGVLDNKVAGSSIDQITSEGGVSINDIIPSLGKIIKKRGT